jgi:hypothetical protein
MVLGGGWLILNPGGPIRRRATRGPLVLERDPRDPEDPGGVLVADREISELICRHGLEVTLEPREIMIPKGEIATIEADALALLRQVAPFAKRASEALGRYVGGDDFRRGLRELADVHRPLVDLVEREFDRAGVIFNEVETAPAPGAPDPSDRAPEVTELSDRLDAIPRDPPQREGRQQPVKGRAGVTATLAGCDPSDHDRPVEVTVVDLIRFGLNEPTGRVCTFEVDGITLTPQGPIDEEKTVSATVAWGGDCEVAGVVRLAGNYGRVSVGLDYTCRHGRHYREEHTLTVEGAFEEELRQDEDERHTDVERLIGEIDAMLSALGDLATTLGKILELGAEVYQSWAPDPFEALSIAMQSVSTFLEVLDGAIGSIWSPIKVSWTRANDRLHRPNHRLAERLPESRPHGTREVWRP